MHMAFFLVKYDRQEPYIFGYDRYLGFFRRINQLIVYLEGLFEAGLFRVLTRNYIGSGLSVSYAAKRMGANNKPPGIFDPSTRNIQSLRMVIDERGKDRW